MSLDHQLFPGTGQHPAIKILKMVKFRTGGSKDDNIVEKKREAASAKARGKDTEAEQAKYPPSKSKGRAKRPIGSCKPSSKCISKCTKDDEESLSSSSTVSISSSEDENSDHVHSASKRIKTSGATEKIILKTLTLSISRINPVTFIL